LAAAQHGVVTRSQLVELGFSPKAIEHRITNGRLHPVRRGVFALGRPELTRQGHWMAAVTSCGPEAVLSHESAAAHWEILPRRLGAIEVSVPAGIDRRPSGIVVHRRSRLAEERTRHLGIPITTPVRTLLDIAPRLNRAQLEAAINEADKRGLTDPETLRSALDMLAGFSGVGILRQTLDRRTFRLTASELERRFLPIARLAGLPKPETGRRLNGFVVDFYWPGLGLVVETDGLRYHCTPAQQAKDRLRDQTHAAAGLTPLRFTHARVCFEPNYVRATLAKVAGRLKSLPRA
jgi:very-short-patch-repair endonuclease